MKDIIGYIGIVLVAISLVALIVDNAMRKKRAAAGEEPGAQKGRGPPAGRAPRKPRRRPAAARTPPVRHARPITKPSTTAAAAET